MTHPALRPVAEQLPFHLDDAPKINEVFVRWRRRPSASDKRLIDIWTYCYVYRYFLIKFSVTGEQFPLPVDQLVSSAFADVQEHLHSVCFPDRFTIWVSRICRNSFANYLRTQYTTVPLEEAGPALTVEQRWAVDIHDAAVVGRDIAAAVAALPVFLQKIASMRLLQGCSYKSISAGTGVSRATARAYVYKVLLHLRRNLRLQALLKELRD